VDIATAFGLLFGLICVVWAITSSPGSLVFINVPAMAITVGGMVAATFIHFSLKQVTSITSVLKKTFFNRLPDEQNLIQKMVNFSAICRRDGALALEKHLPDAGDSFLVKAMRLVVDGQTPEVIEDQLGIEIQYLQERHADGKKLLEFMGASAPAWGMIGTLIGLIQMLGALNDPSKIGSGMATALITTFYGAFLANLVFLPLAGKLGTRSKKEAILRQMVVEGAMGISRGESPTLIRERLQSFISVKHREEVHPNI